VRVGISLASGKHLHDRIMPLRKEASVHKTSLIPPLCIEVPVPSQESYDMLLHQNDSSLVCPQK
jgi:hypothetical protein